MKLLTEILLGVVVMGVVAVDVYGESVPNFVVLFVDDLGYAEDRAIWKGHT